MFRLKDHISIEELLNYGFKKNHFDVCYEYTTEEYIIFCYNKDNGDIKKRFLYIEIRQFGIISKFDKILELFESGIVEHVRG